MSILGTTVQWNCHKIKGILPSMTCAEIQLDPRVGYRAKGLGKSQELGGLHILCWSLWKGMNERDTRATNQDSTYFIFQKELAQATLKFQNHPLMNPAHHLSTSLSSIKPKEFFQQRWSWHEQSGLCALLESHQQRNKQSHNVGVPMKVCHSLHRLLRR